MLSAPIRVVPAVLSFGGSRADKGDPGSRGTKGTLELWGRALPGLGGSHWLSPGPGPMLWAAGLMSLQFADRGQAAVAPSPPM